MIDIGFVLNSALTGVALAMDAFSVSLANGLNEPKMKKSRMLVIAGTFAFFQFLMPMIGWSFVLALSSCFKALEQYIPWIAFALLGFIGGKMVYEGIKNKDGDEEKPAVGFLALMLQGIGTSIDALSAGFTIEANDFIVALLACLIIAVVTFVICVLGVLIGKKFGTKLSNKAGILGGAILILIGLKILISSF